MTIDITAREMKSDLSPEHAVRLSRLGQEEWRLSWLPRQRLSREQAQAGMELDEILSDPAIVYDEQAQARAAIHAARLGIGVDRAVILLAVRLAERLHLDPPPEHVADTAAPQQIPSPATATAERRTGPHLAHAGARPRHRG
ncbi:hypothetical protein [Nocardia sp. NPDC004722]